MSVVKIVILNWNGAAHLRRFLPSVVRTASPGVEIVVADNGSTDGSAALVEREFPSVTLLPAAGKLRFRRRLQPRVGAVGGRLLGAAQLRRRTCGGVVGAADRGARRAARRGCRGAETALLRRARPVRVCGCCGRIHRLVRFPVLSGTYPADVGEGSGAVRRHPRCLLGERCGLLLPCGGIPPHGRFRRRLLRPHGGDRPLLADAAGGVARARRPPKQGVAFGAAARCRTIRRANSTSITATTSRCSSSARRPCSVSRWLCCGPLRMPPQRWFIC